MKMLLENIIGYFYFYFFLLYCTNMTIQLIPDKAEFVYHSSQTAFI